MSVVRIPVTWRGEVEYALVDSDDNERLGLDKYRWNNITGYANHHALGYMHRAILGLAKGAKIVHHLNENKLDNRRENLVVCESRAEANNLPHPNRDRLCGLSWQEREMERVA